MSSESDFQLLCSFEEKAATKLFQLASSEDHQDTYSCLLSDKTWSRKELKICCETPWSSNHEFIDVYVIKNKFRKEKLCTLTPTKRYFQWSKSESSRDQLKLLCSEKVALEAVVSKVFNSEVETDLMDSVLCTPGTKILEGTPDIQTLNENTPLIEVGLDVSPVAPKLSKKRARGEGDLTTPNPKSRRQRHAMKALTTNLTPPAKLRTQETLTESPCRISTDSAVSKQPCNRKPTRCVDLSSRVPKPSNRWGHTLCHVSSDLAVLIGGQGDKTLSKDSIWYLHPEMRTWKCPEVTTEGIRPEYRIGHSANYDPTMRCIYVYGGSKNAKWFHDVHMFDLDEQKWSLVKAEGKAPTRAYHSSTLHRHELWVFGGVFPRPDPQPDGCDNEVHIFSPIMQSWYKPIVMGDKPRARSGHSATLINDMLVVFGGWDFPFCYNDLFVLDLTTVEWSEPKCLGKPPKPRSWHACSSLTNNRIFIHGGYDGDNALHDAHIFDYYSKTWQELVVNNAPSARAGHSCLRLHSDYENEDEDEIMVFGGGDNDGNYFSDMLSFYVPQDPKCVDDVE